MGTNLPSDKEVHFLVHDECIQQELKKQEMSGFLRTFIFVSGLWSKSFESCLCRAYCAIVKHISRNDMQVSWVMPRGETFYDST